MAVVECVMDLAKQPNDQMGRFSGFTIPFGDAIWVFNRIRDSFGSVVLHFPGFSSDAAQLLAEERNIAGIGIDTLSVDYGMSKDFAGFIRCE